MLCLISIKNPEPTNHQSNHRPAFSRPPSCRVKNRTLAEMEQSAAEVQRAAAQLSLCKVDWLRCYESAAGQDVLGSEVG